MTRPVNQPVLAGPRASRQHLAIRCRDNSHNVAVNISDVLSERRNPVRDDGPDQSLALVIPITLGGIRGAITARFIDFRSLHGGSYGD